MSATQTQRELNQLDNEIAMLEKKRAEWGIETIEKGVVDCF